MAATSLFDVDDLGDSCSLYRSIRSRHGGNTNDVEEEEMIVDKIYEHFGEASKNEELKIGETGQVLFVVTCDRHEDRTKRKAKKKKKKVYVAVPDRIQFQTVLEKMAKLNDAESATSVFMTPDNFGIPSKQTAGSVFMKYGDNITFMSGVHVSKVAFKR